MTKTAALELARHNIRVNSIHPGMIDTEMMVEVTSGDQRRHERMEAALPIGRAAVADEIANLALYLASRSQLVEEVIRPKIGFWKLQVAVQERSSRIR